MVFLQSVLQSGYSSGIAAMQRFAVPNTDKQRLASTIIFDYIVNIKFVLVYYGLYRQSYPFTCTCTNISTRGWYKSWRSSTWQIIFGNPYHRCAIENQGFCPQTAQYPATAFGSGTVCTYIIGWDHRQFIIL